MTTQKTIFITGANGLVGQKIVQQLADKNVKVIASGKGEARISMPENAIYISAYTTKIADLQIIFKEFPITDVINCAAATNVDYCELNPEDCHLQNVVSVENLIECCENHGAKLIQVSTDFVFDGLQGPYSEEDAPNPVSIYGNSKLQAELLLQKSNIPWAIARTILVYGVAQGMSRSNIVLWVKKSLEEGKKINVVIDQLRTPTLAEDVAAGLILIALKEATGIYHIGGPEKMTIFEIAMQTAKFWNLDTNLIQPSLSNMIQQPAKRPPITGLSITKAQNEIGYSPRTFWQGLEIINQQMQNS